MMDFFNEALVKINQAELEKNVFEAFEKMTSLVGEELALAYIKDSVAAGLGFRIDTVLDVFWKRWKEKKGGSV